MSHTPGPWKAEQIGGDMAVTISSSNRIATCNWAKTDKEYEANARLIAAAPELLRGCQAALAYLVDQPSKFKENREEAARIIIEAIRKAKGE